MPPTQDISQPVSPGRLPLHLQISEMLVREIQASILLDGERLPPEKEMATNLGIAVGTLRKALADLVDKGLLERVQGSGNYIRHKADVESIYAFFRLELLAGGGLPSAEVLSVQNSPKPKDLPAFGTSQNAFRIRRLRRLNDVNAAIEEIWLDGTYTDNIKKTELSESLYRFYRDSFGLHIARVEDKVGVDDVPDWAHAYVDAPLASHGYIQRLSWDQHGTIAEYSRTWFDPAKACFVARGR